MQMPSEMAASRSRGALDGDRLEIGSWRFAVGDGPFRIKGTPYLGHMKYVEEELPGGKEAMLARLDDPALREFLSQKFLASSLYDIYPLVAAAIPCAEILGIDPREFVLIRASKQATSDLTGVYRFLLALVSTKRLASRIPLLVKQIYEFGAVRIEEMHQGRVLGCSNAEIGRKLFVASSTIKKHLEHVYDKLGVRRRTQALARARELRLLS